MKDWHNAKEVIHRHLAAALLEHGGEMAVGNFRVDSQENNQYSPLMESVHF